MANEPRWSTIAATPAAVGTREARAAGQGSPAPSGPGADSGSSSDGGPAWRTIAGVGDPGVSWATLTGQNLEGTHNAFDTGFWEIARKQDEEQAERGLKDRFTRPDATGVAVYDDPDSGLTFGDVYLAGVKQGNLLTGYAGMDKTQGEQMLARMVLPREVIARAYEQEAGRPLTMTGSISEELDAKRRENSENFAKGKSAQAFEMDVTERAEDLAGSDAAQAVNVGAGVGDGALTGAGVGAVFGGPIGAGIGAVIGGAVGGVGSWLNRDEQFRRFAEAQEQFELAKEAGSTAVGAGDALSGWAAAIGGTLSPVRNLTRGTYDAITGETGDQRSQYNEQGGPLWFDVVDTAGLIVDGVGTFGTKSALTAYTVTMGATVSGDLVATGAGAAAGNLGFNPYSGRYEDIGVKGTALQFASVGIDAAQTAVARGLSGRMTGRGRGMEPGAMRDFQGGFKIGTDATGGRATQRIGFSALIPSEAAVGISARMLARRSVRRSGEDMTRANIARHTATHIDNLTSGRAGIATVMVNAFGEGSEEFVQAGLEALSVGETPELKHLIGAARQGAAMGAGMGAAVHRGSRTRSQQWHDVSTVIRTERGEEPLTEKQWAALSESERAIEGTPRTERDRQRYHMVTEEVRRLGRSVAAATVPELQRAWQVVQARVEEEARNSQPLNEPARLSTHSNFDHGPQDVAVSITAARRDVAARFNALRRVASGEEIRRDNGNLVTASTEQIDYATRVAAADQVLLQRLDQAQATIDAALQQGDVQAVRSEVGRVNSFLDGFWSSREDTDPEAFGKRRSASFLGTRFPLNSAGSFQLMRLQINPQLTLEQNHHTALVPNEIQPMMGGDFDGDEINNMLRLQLPAESYDAMRRGAGQLTSEGTMMKPTTYMESAADAMYDALATGPGHSAFAIANSAKEDLRTKLNTLLLGAGIEIPDVSRVTDDFVRRVGDRELVPALSAFLDTLATRYGDQMRQLGEQIDGSPWLGITRMVEDSLREMANSLSLTNLNAASTAGAVDLPEPSSAMRDYRPQPTPASSELLTGAIQASSWNLFRLQTIFKYNPFREPTAVTDDERASAIQGLIERFTLLNDGLPRSGDEAMFEGTRAQERSIDWLTKIANEMRGDIGVPTTNEAMVLLAGAMVPDVDASVRPTGSKDTVTLGQAVLHEVVTGLRREYESLLSKDEAIAMRLESLDALTNPEREVDGSTVAVGGTAFVELFGSYPIDLLLGDNGANLKMYGTVRSMRDALLEMRQDVRREAITALKKHPQYNQEVGGQGFAQTPYRTLVDQVVQSAQMELHETADGLADGRRARPEKNARRDFHQLHDTLRALATARNAPHSTAAEVRSFLNDDPDLAVRVLEIMEARGLHAGLVQYDEQGQINLVQFPQWIYEVLAEPKTATAEMMMLRNTLIFSRAALTQFSGRLEVDKVSDRILRLWLDLDYRANDKANPRMVFDRASRDDFLALVNESNSVNVFLAQLNQDHRFRTERTPPFMAWARDRSMVEADRFGKGVSDVMDGQSVREALRDAAQMAARELQITEEVDAYLKSNANLLDEIRSARESHATNGNRDPEPWLRFQRWFNEARDLPNLISMSVMIEQGAHINEILGGMGVKGIPPTNVLALGKAIAAQLPTFDSAVGRLLASTTSASANAALTDMTLLARGERTFVMNDGTVVDWEGITAEQALDMLGNPDHAGMAARMMGLTAWDLNPESGISSLTTMLGQGAVGFASDPASQLFSTVNESGRLSGDQLSKFRRLAILEGRSTGPTDPMLLPVLLATQMNLRETAATHVISPRTEERQQMAVQILEDIADSLQYLASLENLYRNDGTGNLRTVVEESTGLRTPLLNRVLRQAGRRARRASNNLIARLVPSEDGPLRDATLEAVRSWLAKVAADANDAGNQAALALSANLKTQFENVDNVLSPAELLVSRFKDYQNPMIQDEIVSLLKSWGDVSNVTAWARPEILRAIDPDTPMVARPTLQHTGEQFDSGVVNLPDMTDAQWETLARAVIAFTMHTSYGIPTTSGVQIAEFPSLSDADELDAQLGYWDPSGVSLTLDMFVPGVMTNPDAQPSKLLLAQMELQRELGPELNVVASDRVEEAIYKLVAPVTTDTETGRRTGNVGQWHAELPTLYHAAIGAAMSAPAESGISMAGKNPQRLRMMGATTQMDWVRQPPDEELSTAVTDVRELFGAVNEGTELDVPVFMDVAESDGTTFRQERYEDRPMAELEGRIVRSVEINVGPGEVINLLGHPRFASGLLLPEWTGVAPGEAGVLSLKTLAASVSQVMTERGISRDQWYMNDITIKFFHPRTKAVSSTRQGTSYDHNAWFDGVRGRTDAAFSQRSHLGLLYFGLDGMIPAAYERSLQAIKKLHSGLQSVTTLPETHRRFMLERGLADISGMLDEMTVFMMRQEIDGKPISVTNYNSLRKFVELMHVVRYVDANGEPKVLSADQAAAMQQRGEDMGPMAEVIGLPIEHVLALMGEQDLASETFTVNGMKDYNFDISRARPYLDFPPEAWSDSMFGGLVAVERDDQGAPLRWATMNLLDYQPLQGMALPKTSRKVFNRPPSSGSQDFFAPYRTIQNERHAERAGSPQANTRWDAQREATKRGAQEIRADGETLVARAVKAVQMGLQGEIADAATYRTSDRSTDNASHDYTTGWLYVHRGVREGSAVAGVLTDVGEATGRPAMGDTVHVLAESFMRPDTSDVDQVWPEARNVLDALMGTGTTIHLPPTLEAGPLRQRMVRHMRTNNYTANQIGADEFVPVVTDATSQAEAAYHSMLNVANYRSSRNRTLIDLSEHNQITEGGLYSVNGGVGALEDFYVREVVQTARYAGYSPITRREQDLETITILKPLLDSQGGMDYLYQQSGATTSAEVADVDRAVENLVDRIQRVIDDDQRSLTPNNGDEFGTGDIIPLVTYNARGELVGIHLYRHGHLPADEMKIRGELPAGNQMLNTKGARLTIDRVKVDDTHTTHRGVMMGSRWLGMQGFIAQMRVPLSNLGSKVFEAGSAMKWTTAPPPDDLLIPDGAVFAGKPVIGAGDIASPESKNSDQWWLNSPDRIVEAVGFDVMPHIVRALYGDNADIDAESTTTLNILRMFSRKYANSAKPQDLVNRNTEDYERVVIRVLQDALRESDGPAVNLLEDSTAQGQADMTMLRLVLSALTAGAPIEEVLHTPGYIGREGVTSSHTMHPVFTTLLEQLPSDHPAKVAYVDQINARMVRTRARDGSGYYLDPGGHSWTRRVANRQVSTMLAYPPMRNTDSNDALSEMAQVRRGQSTVSPTTLAMAHTTWGATAFIDETKFQAREMFLPNTMLHGTPSETAQQTFNLGAGSSPRVVRMDDDLPMNEAEQRHIFLEAMPSRQALSVAIDDSGWYEGMTKAQRDAAQQEFRSKFEEVRSLARNISSVFLTEMIRAAVVRPASLTRDEGEFLTRREAMAALRLIERNLRNEDWPLLGGAVNVISRDALQALYENGYKMKRGRGRNRRALHWDGEDGWVDVMLSYAFTDDPETRRYPATTNIIDGLLYEYRKDVKGLPVTTSKRLHAIIRLAQTRNGVLIASPILRRRAEAPGAQGGRAVYDVQKYDTNEIMLDDLPHSAREIVEQRMTTWESKHGMSGRRRQSPRAEAKRGAQVREDLARTNIIMRFAQLGYVGKTLINVGLYIAAFIELLHRGQQERVVSFLTGQSAASVTGTPEQRQQWRDARNSLSQNPEFYQMLYDNTNWDPNGQAETRVEKRVQRIVNFLAAAFNDPTWGTRNTTMANAFMEAAWDATLKSGDHVSLEQFLDTMTTNPSSLASINPESVRHGYARVEYRRNLQDNLLERTRRWAVEGVINSGGPGTNAMGTLLLRFPTMFFRFRSNTIINMLGLQGPMALVSTLLSERSKRPGGLKDKLTGADEGMDPAITDYTRIEDSVDLTRAIIRSGVSSTQLLMAATFISSRGWGGDEEEEEKLLTRLRRYQKTPVAKDPLALENDFRNAEAWFMDMLPGGLGIPNWTVRIFASPMMGIARFYETGDFRQVYWGFADALGSMPLLNLDSVFTSWEIANQLQAAAEAEAMSDNVEATTEANRLMITAVGTLENMLFESAFTSMLYQAADDWDRDPFAVPAREGGELRRDDVFGQPIPTTAVEDRQDPDGLGKQSYVGRTQADAAIRALAENRPMLAHVLSLINNDSTYLRQNMVPKIRETKTEELTVDEAQRLVMSIYDNETGRESVTEEGAAAVIRGIRTGSVRMDSPALQGVHIPRNMRQKIQTNLIEELTVKYLELGMGSSDALSAAKEEFYGQGYGEPEALGFADILWGDVIPERESHEYMQLNTTYVIGPNGRPVATGLQRSFAAALGLPVMQEFHAGQSSNMPVDPLLNSQDMSRGANLGLRGLVKTDESWVSPTAEELADGIKDSIEEIGEKLDDLADPLGRPFNYGGGFGFGGGGGGFYRDYNSTYVPHYGGMALRMNPQQRVRMMQYGDDLYSIRTNNPHIRRSRINRQRFESRRGRLMQWQ